MSAYPLAYPERLYRPFVENLTRVTEQLEKSGRTLVNQKQQLLTQQTMRLTLQNPQRLVHQYQKGVQDLDQRMRVAAQKGLQAKGRSFSNIIQLLEALNPLKIMDRGYSLTYQNDQVVKSIEDIDSTKSLHIKLQDGVVIASIDSIIKQSKGESS